MEHLLAIAVRVAVVLFVVSTADVGHLLFTVSGGWPEEQHAVMLTRSAPSLHSHPFTYSCEERFQLLAPACCVHYYNNFSSVLSLSCCVLRGRELL